MKVLVEDHGSRVGFIHPNDGERYSGPSRWYHIDIVCGYVCNRSHPDGSIVQGLLTEEYISFCMNYVDIKDPIGLPRNKHLRGFERVGHKNGRRKLHVHTL
jgi:hypothetical protein